MFGEDKIKKDPYYVTIYLEYEVMFIIPVKA